jgi:hypothetical protein
MITLFTGALAPAWSQRARLLLQVMLAYRHDLRYLSRSSTGDRRLKPRAHRASLAMNGTFACLALLLFLSAPARAQSTSPEELAFWQSVSATNDPVELHAYLAAYPTGAFVAIAKYRLQRRPSPSPSPVAIPAATSSPARLVPIRPSFRLVDGVTLDLDATALRSASNLRLTVVPATAPLAVADPDRLVLDSTAVPATRLHLTIPSGPPGTDELRLYYIPNTGTAYVLAARAPVTIEAGVPGAMLVRDLGREAAQLGPIHFEANHRDRPMLIQGAFLNLRPRAEWNVQWFTGQAVEQASRQTLIMTIGQPNARADPSGSTGEAVCVLSVSDAATLDRVSALKVGDPVLVAATPTSWGNAGPSDPVVLDRCIIK